MDAYCDAIQDFDTENKQDIAFNKHVTASKKQDIAFKEDRDMDGGDMMIAYFRERDELMGIREVRKLVEYGSFERYVQARKHLPCNSYTLGAVKRSFRYLVSTYDFFFWAKFAQGYQVSEKEKELIAYLEECRGKNVPARVLLFKKEGESYHAAVWLYFKWLRQFVEPVYFAGIRRLNSKALMRKYYSAFDLMHVTDLHQKRCVHRFSPLQRALYHTDQIDRHCGWSVYNQGETDIFSIVIIDSASDGRNGEFFNLFYHPNEEERKYWKRFGKADYTAVRPVSRKSPFGERLLSADAIHPDVDDCGCSYETGTLEINPYYDHKFIWPTFKPAEEGIKIWDQPDFCNQNDVRYTVVCCHSFGAEVDKDGKERRVLPFQQDVVTVFDRFAPDGRSDLKVVAQWEGYGRGRDAEKIAWLLGRYYRATVLVCRLDIDGYKSVLDFGRSHGMMEYFEWVPSYWFEINLPILYRLKRVIKRALMGTRYVERDKAALYNMMHLFKHDFAMMPSNKILARGIALLWRYRR